MTDYKPQERKDLEELYKKQNVRINDLEQENKSLKERAKHNDAIIDELLVAEKGADILGILENEYEFSS